MENKTDTAVLSILESIKNKNAQPEEQPTDEVDLANNKEQQEVPRGIPKSGRFWKSKKERFATVNKTKGLRQNFQKKTALRLEKQRTKELSRQIQEELKQKELDRKERRRQNLKQSEENKRKAEVVQVITNTAKLKRMRKKQMRFIQKRDTNKEVEAGK